jgi:hypothetical protein
VDAQHVCHVQVLNMLLNMERAHRELLEHGKGQGQQQVQQVRMKGRIAWMENHGDFGN